MPLLAAREDVELVGVCGVDAELLRRVQDEFGFAHTTEDYRELLELDLDGVVICSPHHLHYEHARAAIDRGLHVLCEKPMALDPGEAWDLVRLAADAGVELLVPYGWNYKTFVPDVKELAAGVGRIEYALCHMASPTKAFFGGDRNTVPSAWQPTLTAPDPATWQTKEQGGGYAHGQITHAAALLFWLTDLRPASVSCVMSAGNAPVDLYNAAHVTFDDGAVGTVSGAATLPDDEPFQIDLRIFGSDGAFFLDLEHERTRLVRHDGVRRAVEIPSGAGAYSCETPPLRFIDLIQGRGTNDSPGWIAARTVELIDAMHRSAADRGAPTLVRRPAAA
jgi:predicted dehydrogenase